MKVTEIEVHEITLEYHDWIAYQLNHYYGPRHRTVYVAHTDDGRVGLGECGTTDPQDVIDQYIGSNPFEWLGDETSLGLGTCMYDLMGQAAEVPVYKLIGRKHRAWVPVGSWTVSCHPDRMAEALVHYAEQGYTWMKYHLSPFENVFDQTEAMQAVAPPGFKIHYDFTMGGTDDHTFELLHGLARYPIAGCFEDPLPAEDLMGYIELRKRSPLPVVLHHSPFGNTYEVFMKAADVYMTGGPIGGAILRAGLFAAGNIPFMLQNIGGNITRAMTCHQMAAFPSANFHFFSDCETWKSDVVVERLEPVNGFIRVLEKPGLGLTLDRAELERLKKLRPPESEPWIVKSRFANGTRLYMRYHWSQTPHALVRPDWAGGLVPMSYAAPISTEYWDDDGTPEYRDMSARLEREGMILERPE